MKCKGFYDMIRKCRKSIKKDDIMLVQKGKFVRIRSHLILPEDRNVGLPESTKKVPYKMWAKGYLLNEAELYEEAKIKTATNRIISGIVKEVEPKYKHNFGDYIPEIHKIRSIILNEVWNDDNE